MSLSHILSIVGTGDSIFDAHRIERLLPNNPRVAFLAARRLAFAVQGAASPNDLCDDVSQLPGFLSTCTGYRQSWILAAGQVGLDSYTAVPHGLLPLTDYGYDQFETWYEPGYAGEWREYISVLLRQMLVVFARRSWSLITRL
jgi:hypothetical protein